VSVEPCIDCHNIPPKKLGLKEQAIKNKALFMPRKNKQPSYCKKKNLFYLKFVNHSLM
jgi:hypothetical protein